MSASCNCSIRSRSASVSAARSARIFGATCVGRAQEAVTSGSGSVTSSPKPMGECRRAVERIVVISGRIVARCRPQDAPEIGDEVSLAVVGVGRVSGAPS